MVPKPCSNLNIFILKVMKMICQGFLFSANLMISFHIHHSLLCSLHSSHGRVKLFLDFFMLLGPIKKKRKKNLLRLSRIIIFA